MNTPKKSILGSSLSSLTSAVEPPKAEPAAPVQMTPPKVPENDSPVGVLFRMNPADHEVVSDYARQHGMSIQELIEKAINKMRRNEGLKEIEGRPRSKTRRRR